MTYLLRCGWFLAGQQNHASEYDHGHGEPDGNKDMGSVGTGQDGLIVRRHIICEQDTEGRKNEGER
jgi:hypothetical protein